MAKLESLLEEIVTANRILAHEGVVIIDGKMQHAVLLELFTNQGTGTLIHK